MRTTDTLDEDIAAVSVSRLSGEKLGKEPSRMDRRGLEQKNAPRRKGRRRFPIFDISPRALVIPASRIERVLDDAGLF